MNSLNINFTRAYHLLVRQVVFNSASFLLALLAFCGPVAVVSAAYLYFQHSSVLGLEGFYKTFLFIGGYMFTSKVFTELKSPQKSYAYLTLPVSNLEKLLVAWFLTAPLFITIYSCFLILILLINNVVSSEYMVLSDIFNKQYFRETGVYLATQPIFLLGACYFKKNNFFKTILAIFISSLGLLAITASVGFLLFHDQSFQGNINLEFGYDLSSAFVKTSMLTFLGLFFLLVTYFKLKEREI